MDRFLMQIRIDYPDQNEELDILRRDRQTHFGEDHKNLETRLQPETVIQARREVADIHIEPALEEYMVSLVHGTRDPSVWIPEWQDYVEFGASPRATLALARASSAYAYLNGRDYVIPDDIIEVAPEILQHRILPTFNARADQVNSNTIIKKLLNIIPVP